MSPRALAAALMFMALPAAAAETGGCGAFAWPIEADKALLAGAQRIASGSQIDVSSPKAVRVELVAAGEAGFEVSPEKPAAAAALAGTLRFQASAGLYQITTTDRVWLDLAQGGKALPEAGFSGVLDCDGARKSVRFELKDGPAVLQISGAPARTVAVAVTRAARDAP